jgi:uncharacterized protein YndB with AHSA1/START domain
VFPKRHKRTRRRTVLIACGATVALVLLLILASYAAGKTLRSEREVLISMTLNQDPEAIYETLTDYGNLPAWLDQAKGVVIRSKQHGTTIWTATFSSGEQVSVFASEIEPPSDLVWRLTSQNRHVGGHWEFVLKRRNDGTQLSLTAIGVAWHPVDRLRRESLIDDETQLLKFAGSLAAKFGEDTSTIQCERKSRLFVYGVSPLMDRIDRSAARLK